MVAFKKLKSLNSNEFLKIYEKTFKDPDEFINFLWSDNAECLNLSAIPLKQFKFIFFHSISLSLKHEERTHTHC